MLHPLRTKNSRLPHHDLIPAAARAAVKIIELFIDASICSACLHLLVVLYTTNYGVIKTCYIAMCLWIPSMYDFCLERCKVFLRKRVCRTEDMKQFSKDCSPEIDCPCKRLLTRD